MQSLPAGRNRRWLHCILLLRIPFELQEHQHDCTPNDLLAAYAALALRPPPHNNLLPLASLAVAHGCTPGLHLKHTAKKSSKFEFVSIRSPFPWRARCNALDISMLQKLRQTWFSNVRADVLAGLLVALSPIPEAIAFSIIAGVDPKVGLYASFCICAVIAFVGGRPGMISGTTGAMALLMVTLVKEHGHLYLQAATLLCGVLQILAADPKLGSLIHFV